MEHMGDKRCKEVIINSSHAGDFDAIASQYKKMIDWLIKLHNLSSNVNDNDMTKLRRFGKESITEEIRNFKYYLQLNENDSKHFDSLIENVLNNLLPNTKNTDNTNKSDQFTLCHRDYQIRNMMYHNNDIYVIDAQDMCLGPELYDLASLLYDSNVILSNDFRHSMAKYYWGKKIHNTKTQEAENDFHNKLKLFGLLRIMKSYGIHMKLFVENSRNESYCSIKNNKHLLNDILNSLGETDSKYMFKMRDLINKYRVVPVILAAGKGSRMKSDLPKTICEINGKPMLFYILDQVVKLNTFKIVLVVGYKKDIILKKIKEYPLDLDIEIVEQHEMLGTGHAVLQSRTILDSLTCSTLVLYGDKPCITYSTLTKLIKTHYSKNFETTILTYKGEPSYTRCGRIIRSKSGNIIQMYEDENKDFVSDEFNGGIQIFDNKTLFSLLQKITNKNKQNEYYLTDIVKLITEKQGKIGNLLLTTSNSGEVMNVNTPEDLTKALYFFQ